MAVVERCEDYLEFVTPLASRLPGAEILDSRFRSKTDRLSVKIMWKGEQVAMSVKGIEGTDTTSWMPIFITADIECPDALGEQVKSAAIAAFGGKKIVHELIVNGVEVAL